VLSGEAATNAIFQHDKANTVVKSACMNCVPAIAARRHVITPCLRVCSEAERKQAGLRNVERF
jgi:hypothetical protein